MEVYYIDHKMRFFFAPLLVVLLSVLPSCSAMQRFLTLKPKYLEQIHHDELFSAIQRFSGSSAEANEHFPGEEQVVAPGLPLVTSTGAPENKEPVVPVLTLKIQPHYLKQIRSGAKTVEGRVSNQQFRGVKVGQILRLESRLESEESGAVLEDNLLVRITQKRHFDSFKLMLAEMGLTNCLPDFSTIEDGVAEYHKLIPGAWVRVNKKRDGGLNGVEAFGIEVV